MPLHCSCYIIASFLFHCYLWAYGLGFNGQNSCYANPLSTSLPLLGFIGPHSCRASPFHSSSTQLLLFYLFYAHGLSLNPLGFLGLTTTSLPLISFRVYWPLSQPYESTNLFLGLPRPIDFFFTSYYCHGFNISFFGLPQPICFFFITYYFCGFADHYSCYSGLLGFALLFSLPTFLHIVRFLLSLGFLSKVGINIQQPYILYFFYH